jgi:hypothetical protein
MSRLPFPLSGDPITLGDVFAALGVAAFVIGLAPVVDSLIAAGRGLAW